MTVLFSAESSPWLNPVEHLFNRLKKLLRRHCHQQVREKLLTMYRDDLTQLLQQELARLDTAAVGMLWCNAVASLTCTIMFGYMVDGILMRVGQRFLSICQCDAC